MNKSFTVTDDGTRGNVIPKSREEAIAALNSGMAIPEEWMDSVTDSVPSYKTPSQLLLDYSLDNFTPGYTR